MTHRVLRTFAGVALWQLLLVATSLSQKAPVDPFGKPYPSPPPPGLEEKLRKPYIDILTSYQSLRQHPCAKGKSLKELDQQWAQASEKARDILAKAKPSPNPPRDLSLAEAARYLNKQFQEQKLPFRVWFMAAPVREYDELTEYYKEFLNHGVGLTSKFYIDHPTVSLWTMIMTLHEAKQWSYVVFENGDIVFAQLSDD
jgi:hypothetical protein